MEEQIPFNFELKSREKLLEKCQDSMQLFREEKKKKKKKEEERRTKRGRERLVGGNRKRLSLDDQAGKGV